MIEPGYDVLATGLYIAKPGSGLTIVIFDTTANSTASGASSSSNFGARYKGLIWNLESSHDSAANGMTIDESDDGGLNWSNVYSHSYVQATDGRFKRTHNTLSAPDFRVRYANSANVLTTWRFSLLGERHWRL